ncbi:MAG: mannose-1-phosphate guanylyltransferase/mannose-6-phosphate isomerase [Deltaproteobacteria bacterium]|nr:mannose-1-phosphate guanylyltransferase/mannose-6-phosphate isomerase [Deltaproteobacteria bacterium]
MHKIIPVILCGGIGSRLWPVSRQSLPKQFAPLISGASLFEAAVQRAASVSETEPVIVCSSDYRFIAQKQSQTFGVNGNILLEPSRRNTAPAVFAATHFINSVHGDELILVMPSDHYIPDKKAFVNMVQLGCVAAMGGAFVTFGVKPEKPETGYGYIELGEEVSKDCYDAKRFLEKPDLRVAEQIFAAGKHLWNAGIFLFKASTLINLAEQFEPYMLASVMGSVDRAVKDNNFWHIDSSLWGRIEERSIDYAIIEKADNIKCVSFHGRWSDLGDWNTLGSQFPLDDMGNLVNGGVSQINCRNTTLWTESERVHLAGLGLKNIVAIATDDAVLVADASCVQDVRNVVDYLSEKDVLQAHQHSRDYRPWGWFESLVTVPGYQVKRLNVYPGAALSLQSHQYRSEHWVVVFGTATVTVDEDLLTIKTNSSVYIQSGQKHRLSNMTRDPLIVIEVQTGSYLGEDDIIRYEDVYNRVHEIDADQ